MMPNLSPVLILGGTGQAGAGAARVLRRWYPDLPLTIGGRDLGRAQRIADGLGGATAVVVDPARADLGLPDAGTCSAVVAALWDSRLNGLRHAQRNGVPYLSISSGLLDIGPEVVAGVQQADAAPVMVASHICAGSATLATLHLAGEFARVDRVRLGAVLDEGDAGGPAGLADLERFAAVTSAGYLRRDGVFTWIPEADAAIEVASIDGALVPGQAIPVPDVPGIALATGAPDVRFDFAVGESAGRRRGEPASFELLIEIDGSDAAGAPLRIRRHLVHPGGQRPVTAVGIALGVERLLGLRGAPAKPGIHTPESLIDPAHAVDRLLDSGAELVGAELVGAELGTRG
jgi:hypothetical protein